MRKRRLFLSVLAIAALLVAVDDAEAKRLKQRTRDRNVPTGWCPIPTVDLMLFSADGPTAEIKITANDYSEGIFVDNIYVVAASALNSHLVEDPCDFEAHTYFLSAPFSQQPYFEIFDVEPNGWLGTDAFFVPGFSAPRWPFDVAELPTDSASVFLEPGGSIWTTINRLVPGTSYYLGAWWFWDDSGTGPANLTFDVDTRDPAALYLTDGRFRVEADWRTSTASAAAEAVPLTDDTGYFWFFDRANVEVVVKVLNACAVNGRFWVFASGLTNVGVDIVVTDLATGATFSVSNPLGSNFVPRFATDAFVCP